MSAIKLVRRGSSAAAAPPVTGGLPFYGSWTAASGEWPLPWTTVVVGDASDSQNSGTGVLTRNATSNSFIATYPSTAPAVDVDMRVLVTLSSAASVGNGSEFHALLRWSGGMGTAGPALYQPASCYGVRFRAPGSGGGANTRGIALYVSNENGSVTDLFSDPGFSGPHGVSWIRFQVQGSVLRIKLWASTQSEPDTWLYEGTDTSITTLGYAAVARGNMGGANSVQVHSLSLTAPV